MAQNGNPPSGPLMGRNVGNQQQGGNPTPRRPVMQPPPPGGPTSFNRSRRPDDTTELPPIPPGEPPVIPPLGGGNGGWRWRPHRPRQPNLRALLLTGAGLVVALLLFAIAVPHARTTIVVLLVLAACAALWAYKSIDIAKRRIPSSLQMQIPIAESRVTPRETEGLLHLFHDNTRQSELLGVEGVQDKILLITHRSKVFLFGPLTLIVLFTITALVLVSQVHQIKGSSGAFGIGLLVVLVVGIFVVQNGKLNSVGARFVLVAVGILAGAYILFFFPKNQGTGNKQSQQQETITAHVGWQVYLVILLTGVLIGLIMFVRWKSFYFVVTNLEAILIHQYPATLFFIPPRQLSMLLIHTGTIGNTRPFLGTIFNYGSLDMDSGEERDKPFNDIRGIKGPDHVTSIVKDSAKQARGLYGGI